MVKVTQATNPRDPFDWVINRPRRAYSFVTVIDGVAVPGTRGQCVEIYVGGGV